MGAEVNDAVVGWGAIRGDRLEGLYTEPDFAGRGIGTGLLSLIEVLMRGRRCAQKQAQMPSRSTFGAVMSAAGRVHQKGPSQSRSTCYSPSEVFHSCRAFDIARATQRLGLRARSAVISLAARPEEVAGQLQNLLLVAPARCRHCRGSGH
jgi:GNAT superfamily N-acetyltransferase